MNGWRTFLAAGMLLCATAHAAEVGEPAPLFSGQPLQSGPAVSLEQFRGKIIYLDFWASWCGPCRHSLPALETLRGEFGPAGFEVIAVNLDEAPRDGLDFLKKYPVTYPNVGDAEGRIARLYDVKAMPMSYLIDRQGVVRLVHQGFNKKDVPRLRAAVAQLVEEKT